MRRSIIGVLAGLVALAAMSAAPAEAKPPGVNGQIVFVHFDPLLGNPLLFTVNPDGSHEHQVLTAGCPRWSPDGTRIAAACVAGLAPRSSAAIINPDDGSYRVLPRTDPDRLETHCPVWSPDAERLACEGEGETDPSLNGVYTIRSADGGDLTRVTSNPGGVDIPGDYAPNGKRLVFARVDHPTDPAALGLYVVKVGHNRLRQITPPGTLVGESGGDWSPQGNEIVFSQRVTPDALSSIWAVHADGTGLHEIPVQAQPACGGPSSDPSSQGCFQPRWSPDGKKIVFARGTSNNDSNIYTVNLDGSGLAQVTHGGADSSPDWGTHPLIG